VEYKVILTPPARHDLRSIGNYIAQDNSEAAKKFCRNLLLEALTLKIFPDRGQRIRGSKARLLFIEHISSFSKLMRRQAGSKSFAFGTAREAGTGCV